MPIYTRRGDDGSTGLSGGRRVSKADLRVEAYGEVDELNAVIGWAIESVRDESTRQELRRVQSDLLALGAQLADPALDVSKLPEKARISEDRVREMEGRIDAAEAQTGRLRVFVLPGGCPGAAALHVARTVCRRAERRVVQLSRGETVPPDAVRYLNRLSDMLFALARLENHRAGVPDVPWT